MPRDVVRLLSKEENDLEMQAGLLLAYIGSQLAQWVYDARTRAGLSQSGLADRIDTSQSAIARLEDADYSGHSLRVISKIACALGQSLEIQVNPKRWRARKPGKVGGKARKKAIGRKRIAKKVSARPASSRR